jgi:hypothetical protein
VTVARVVFVLQGTAVQAGGKQKKVLVHDFFLEVAEAERICRPIVWVRPIQFEKSSSMNFVHLVNIV